MQQFLGRYELLGLIATGGMGRVHLARVVGEGGFEREVALKVMHEHLLHEPDFIAMFLDEARLAARIRHPNVVPTIDVQKTPESLFLVMEFVEGLALSGALKQLRKKGSPLSSGELKWDTDQGELVKRGKKRPVPLPLDIAAKVMLDVLAGLQAAHDLTDRDGQPLNLVHRDISPANVLVGKDGVSRITDFGVARAETRLTATQGGQIKGKLPYMPPEQIMADKVDARADLYSAAVVLWECLTGRRLFNAEHQGALLKAVLKGTSERPSSLHAAVPEAVDEVCMRAMSVDPQHRYPTAGEFADALEAAVRSSGQNVANTRRIAAFVKEFQTNTHQLNEARKSVPGSWPSSLNSNELGSSPSAISESFARSKMDLETMRTGQRTSPGQQPPEEERSGGAIHSAGPTHTAAVLSTSSQLTQARSKRPLIIGLGVGAALVCGAAAAVVVVRGTAGESKDPTAAATATETALPAATETAAAPATTTSAAPDPTTTESSESQTSTPEQPVAVRTPGVRTPRTPKTATKPKTTAAPKTGPADSLPSDYLPPEL